MSKEQEKPDKFQKRYLAHQKRKAKVLAEIVAERHSDRQFGKGIVQTAPIVEAMMQCPSSCDRHGVSVAVVTERDDKNILGGLLVGGVGWIHRADKIILLFADPEAYKAPGEIAYMPYLDAGAMVQQAYLTATSLGYAVAYANPNIREQHLPLFKDLFGYDIFCGAIALGVPHDK